MIQTDLTEPSHSDYPKRHVLTWSTEGAVEALLLFHPLTGVDEVASSKSPVLEGEVARLLLEPIEMVPVHQQTSFQTQGFQH